MALHRVQCTCSFCGQYYREILIPEPAPPTREKEIWCYCTWDGRGLKIIVKFSLGSRALFLFWDPRPYQALHLTFGHLSVFLAHGGRLVHRIQNGSQQIHLFLDPLRLALEGKPLTNEHDYCAVMHQSHDQWFPSNITTKNSGTWKIWEQPCHLQTSAKTDSLQLPW